jgi:ubiquinone/menaquinone biosynthesis C-methylase UbiE
VEIKAVSKTLMKTPHHINEAGAAEAFSKQSGVFDQLYGKDGVIRYKRERVRKHMLDRLKPGSKLLELNCGTGEDALFFAQKGFTVHATDISEAMLSVLDEKSGFLKGLHLTTEQCSFTQLTQLKNHGPFDAVYSNFGGLNCTGELDKVLVSLTPLVKPGGLITMVIISPFCFWETLLVFKGRFSTAFRRFFSSNGRKARVEGVFFNCWYYSPSFIRKHINKEFEQVGLEGLCTIVPPSYIEGFSDKYPKLFRFLSKKENSLKSYWPWRSMGDYFIISLRKKN